MTLRHLKMGLNTVLGFKKQGFFIPYRYADSVPTSRQGAPYGPILALMQIAEGNFEAFLQGMSAYKNEILSFGENAPPAPRWTQDWFPRLDGAAAYTMVRTLKPKRIIEIGSGHSTRFMMQAIKDGGLETQFTAIDPAPRADISKLPLSIFQKTVQEADPDIFATLESGDILFIDSSHIAMPGTDVDFLFLDILPGLPAGVTIHIHDIFLPHDYPQDWHWRGYNEQQVVAPLLSGNGYELLFSSQYVQTYMAEQFASSVIGKIALPKGAFETSLWIKKKS